MMQRITATLLLMVLGAFGLFGQTMISGVINDYQSILEICGPSTLRLSDVSAYAANDRIMIWQGSGATINTSNSAAFGDITDTAQVGYYEVNTVCSVSGDTLQLQYDLLHTYDASAALQAIRVPVYQNAEVVGTLTATPWDGSIGGVIALEVTGTLTLSANIDASGNGYEGGQYVQLSSSCNFMTNATDYYYAAGYWEGQAKGEGIAATVSSREWGRGPQGNGGGGGNDHNSGGGGGGHFGMGGQGGQNQEPGSFNCDGDYPGLGGNVLQANQQRLYFGGGGGAGHGNNNDPGSISDGGNGGGIIYLQAAILQGNGYALLASGTDGGNASNDGAGGGGAGGSILLDVGSLSGGLTLNVLGGDGGDANNDGANRCFGPGGGGGGGIIYTVNGFGGMTTQLTGGIAGQTINTSAGCSGSLGATNGGAGSAISGITVQSSTALASGCAFLLSLDQVEIDVEVTSTGYKVIWTTQEKDWVAWQVHWMGTRSGSSGILGGLSKNYVLPTWQARYVQLEGIKKDGTTDRSDWIALPKGLYQACDKLPNPWPEGTVWHNAWQVPVSLSDMLGVTRWQSKEPLIQLPDHLSSGWYVVQLDGQCTRKVFVP